MRKKFVLLMLLAFGVSTTLVAQNESTASGTSSLQKSKKSNFIATISYGLAFRIDGSADDPDPNFNAVVKDLKSGSAIDINLYYLLGNRRTAIGLKYNQFN